jgi:RecA/RadA recombinase
MSNDQEGGGPNDLHKALESVSNEKSFIDFLHALDPERTCEIAASGRSIFLCVAVYTRFPTKN